MRQERRQVVHPTIKRATQREMYEEWRKAIHVAIEPSPECKMCNGRGQVIDWLVKLLVERERRQVLGGGGGGG
jgi:hypothetical protein